MKSRYFISNTSTKAIYIFPNGNNTGFSVSYGNGVSQFGVPEFWNISEMSNKKDDNQPQFSPITKKQAEKLVGRQFVRQYTGKNKPSYQ